MEDDSLERLLEKIEGNTEAVRKLLEVNVTILHLLVEGIDDEGDDPDPLSTLNG